MVIEAGLAFRSLLGSLLYCYHSGHLYIQGKMPFWLKINFCKGILVFISNVWGFVKNKEPTKNPQPDTAVRQWKTELHVCKPSCFQLWKGKYIQQVKHSSVIRAATSHLGDGNSQSQSWSIYSDWQQRMCCRYIHDWDHSEQLSCMWGRENYMLTKQISTGYARHLLKWIARCPNHSCKALKVSLWYMRRDPINKMENTVRAVCS